MGNSSHGAPRDNGAPHQVASPVSLWPRRKVTFELSAANWGEVKKSREGRGGSWNSCWWRRWRGWWPADGKGTLALLDLQQAVTLSPIVRPSTPALPQAPDCREHYPASPPPPSSSHPLLTQPHPCTPQLKLSLQAIATGVESIPEHNAYALNGCFSMPPVRCHQQMGS